MKARRAKVLDLYRRCMRSAARCPESVHRDTMRLYAQQKFRENKTVRDSGKIELLIKAGEEELVSMDYYHSIREQRQKAAEAFLQQPAVAASSTSVEWPEPTVEVVHPLPRQKRAPASLGTVLSNGQSAATAASAPSATKPARAAPQQQHHAALKATAAARPQTKARPAESSPAGPQAGSQVSLLHMLEQAMDLLSEVQVTDDNAEALLQLQVATMAVESAADALRSGADEAEASRLVEAANSELLQLEQLVKITPQAVAGGKQGSGSGNGGSASGSASGSSGQGSTGSTSRVMRSAAATAAPIGLSSVRAARTVIRPADVHVSGDPSDDPSLKEVSQWFTGILRGQHRMAAGGMPGEDQGAGAMGQNHQGMHQGHGHGHGLGHHPSMRHPGQHVPWQRPAPKNPMDPWQQIQRLLGDIKPDASPAQEANKVRYRGPVRGWTVDGEEDKGKDDAASGAGGAGAKEAGSVTRHDSDDTDDEDDEEEVELGNRGLMYRGPWHEPPTRLPWVRSSGGRDDDSWPMPNGPRDKPGRARLVYRRNAANARATARRLAKERDPGQVTNTSGQQDGSSLAAAGGSAQPVPSATAVLPAGLTAADADVAPTGAPVGSARTQAGPASSDTSGSGHARAAVSEASSLLQRAVDKMRKKM